MLHKCREIEIAEYVFVPRLDSIRNLSSLVDILGYLVQLADKYLIISGVGVRYWSIEAGEDLGSAGSHETTERLLKYFHAVLIDQLRV